MQRNFIFSGGYSTRYHTADVHNRQDIGNHSFGVAWFCELVTQGRCTKDLIMAALSHDLAEHIVGDIPSPSKRELNLGTMFDAIEQKQLDSAGVGHYGLALNSNEQQVLKFADCMEGLMFCIRERKIGNRNVEIIFDRYVSYIKSMLEKTTLVDWYNKRIIEILGEILTEWQELV